MKIITAKELKDILEKHKHWIYEDCEGWEDMCADLRDADLRDANFRYANLSDANLSDANFRYADLRNANFRYADFSCADLRNANFRYANLSGADLRDADLSGADLRDANFRYANLRSANLRDADLSGADLSGADLRDADLSGAKNVPYIPMVCPEEGMFIGWKKAVVEEKKVIVKLEIPASAKRSSATSRKCRCDKAKTLEIYNLDGTVAEERKCHSVYDNNFIYEVGKTVKVDNFNEDRWDECSQGIHFFINRQEAIIY